MGTVLVAGTRKGAALFRRGAAGEGWQRSMVLPGWSVTAAAREEGGRAFLAVASPVYGPALFVSDDLEDWRQLEAAPRYAEGAAGNEMHNRLIGSGDPMGRFAGSGRYVDQIWTLHAAHGRLYAGVSEAGLFVSDDRGETWQGLDGLNEHRTRPDWQPGFGGLCAHTVLCDAGNRDRLWVGISAAGFFRSDDGGRSWQAKNEGVPGIGGHCVHCVTHDPQDAATLYRQDHYGVYLSRDGGDSWQLIEDGLPVSELSDGHRCSFGFPIALHRQSGTVFTVPLAGDGLRYPQDGRLAVYRTRSGGNRWEAAASGLPEETYAGVLRGAMAADPDGVYFGTTSGALYGSADLGESWQEIASGLPRVLSVAAFAA